MSQSKNNKELLGKGIRSLLKSIDADLKTSAGDLKPEVVQQVTSVNRIPLSQIITNPKQPRRDFAQKDLEELAASIKMHDIIQPLTVVALAKDQYQIIAGERRWRASKMAGLTDVPVFVRNVNDQSYLELALLENLQRKDLNAIEIGISYKRMMDELNLTQEQVAERMSKDRSTVTNFIRLLKLPPDIQLAVRNNVISMGHARCLLSLEDIEKQLFVYNEISAKHLSVRATEELVKKVAIGASARQAVEAKSNKSQTLDPTFQRIQDKLCNHFKTKVVLKHDPQTKKGEITLSYFSADELHAILQIMKVIIT
ncbi:MAG: ParB/RepB/Spo0J family partition protein [Phycisphaerales bacterium]|nr:ParB/RepB/Spo0J family partition protein [Phycisphaerales bacterium]